MLQGNISLELPNVRQLFPLQDDRSEKACTFKEQLFYFRFHERDKLDEGKRQQLWAAKFQGTIF